MDMEKMLVTDDPEGEGKRRGLYLYNDLRLLAGLSFIEDTDETVPPTDLERVNAYRNLEKDGYMMEKLGIKLVGGGKGGKGKLKVELSDEAEEVFKEFVMEMKKVRSKRESGEVPEEELRVLTELGVKWDDLLDEKKDEEVEKTESGEEPGDTAKMVGKPEAVEVRRGIRVVQESEIMKEDVFFSDPVPAMRVLGNLTEGKNMVNDVPFKGYEDGQRLTAVRTLLRLGYDLTVCGMEIKRLGNGDLEYSTNLKGINVEMVKRLVEEISGQMKNFDGNISDEAKRFMGVNVKRLEARFDRLGKIIRKTEETKEEKRENDEVLAYEGIMKDLEIVTLLDHEMTVDGRKLESNMSDDKYEAIIRKMDSLRSETAEKMRMKGVKLPRLSVLKKEKEQYENRAKLRAAVEYLRGGDISDNARDFFEDREQAMDYLRDMGILVKNSKDTGNNLSKVEVDKRGKEWWEGSGVRELVSVVGEVKWEQKVRLMRDLDEKERNDELLLLRALARLKVKGIQSEKERDWWNRHKWRLTELGVVV